MSANKRGDPSCTQTNTHMVTEPLTRSMPKALGAPGRTCAWPTRYKQQPSLGNDFLSTLGRGFSIQFAPAECFSVIRLEAWHEACSYGSAPLRADRYRLAPAGPNSPFTQFQFQSTLLGWLFYIQNCQSINIHQKGGCNCNKNDIKMSLKLLF